MPKFSLYICIKYLRRFLRDMLYSKAICCLSVVILNHTWLSQLLFISFTISHNSFWIFFPPIIFISWRLITLQYCSGFCHTLTWISHGFTCVPHPEPPPTSLPIPSLWVIPVHQPWALNSCIQPGLAIFFTLDNIHVSMLFFQIIPPSPSPIESKSLFYTSVSLFLSCT